MHYQVECIRLVSARHPAPQYTLDGIIRVNIVGTLCHGARRTGRGRRTGGK